MPVTIGSNIASLQAQRRLNEGSDTLSRVYERLSSGQRINRASDDAAGLAVSSALRADVRIFQQGLRNIDDGLSLLNVADGALSQVSSILSRVTELAEQSANGVYSTPQRSAIDREAQALLNEYSRITATTSFNGVHLFDGSNSSLRLQHGMGIEESTEITLNQLFVRPVGDGTFGSTISIAAGGSHARDLQIADVNNDGISDLIAGNNSPTGVQILLGDGQGNYTARSSVTTGTQSFKLVDLNADNNLDLLTVSISGGALQVYLGNGNGSFSGVNFYGNLAGSASYSFVTGDFNSDGKIDAVMQTIGMPAAAFLVGNGNGSFKAALTVDLVASGIQFDSAAGDINSDGFLDFFALSNNTASSIVLGNGNGTFKSPITYLAANSNSAVSFNDFNEDGKLDLILTSHFTGIEVALGNGNGSFSSGTVMNSATRGAAQIVGDVNGDGHLDIITGSFYQNNLQVFFGNGNGTFKSSLSYAATAPTSIAIGDINGDGVFDIVATNYSGSALQVNLQSTHRVNTLQVDLTTQSGARSALTTISEASATVNSERGRLGAVRNRLETVLGAVQVRSVNSESAAARITDADIAAETATLTRMQILQHAAAAVLAQANQQPTLALQLLRG